jgi:hypothetical protein
VELNKNRASPIITDLMDKPFHGSNRSIEMIFVRARNSKKENAQRIHQQIYNGSKRAYSRGDMLFFIPAMPKVEAQCNKFIFDHKQFPS